MDAVSRRNEIVRLLKSSEGAIKGIDLADRFKVTRQVIVKDMALLKAKDSNIISTSEGYLYLSGREMRKRIFFVKHDGDGIYDELSTILKYGGVIEDIVVDHPYYGELTASLYLRTMKDLENFNEKFLKSGLTPLSEITDGEHMHTVSASDEESLDQIEKELSEKGYLIGD